MSLKRFKAVAKALVKAVAVVLIFPMIPVMIAAPSAAQASDEAELSQNAEKIYDYYEPGDLRNGEVLNAYGDEFGSPQEALEELYGRDRQYEAAGYADRPVDRAPAIDGPPVYEPVGEEYHEAAELDDFYR